MFITHTPDRARKRTDLAQSCYPHDQRGNRNEKQNRYVDKKKTIFIQIVVFQLR